MAEEKEKEIMVILQMPQDKNRPSWETRRLTTIAGLPITLRENLKNH